MKYIVLFLTLQLSYFGFSQNCSESAALRKGGWITGSDAGGSGTGLTPKFKLKIKPLLDSLALLIKKGYPEPTGSQGKWYRNYQLESFHEAAAAYQVVANFKGYNCNKLKNPAGEISLLSETATWMYIQVNGIWTPNGFETPQYFFTPNEHDGIYSLPPRQVLREPQPGYPGRKKIDPSLPGIPGEYPVFTFEQAYDSWDHSYNRREVIHVVFITPDYGIPYEPLSIGDFLNLNEKRLQQYLKTNGSFGYDLSKEENLLKQIPLLRKKYESRLNEPVYVPSANWDAGYLTQTDVFKPAGEGYLICKRSKRYFTKQENHRPAFIAVVWRWQPEAPYSVNMHESIKKNFDFRGLKKFLLKP